MIDKVWHIWVSGGWVMIPLFGLAVLLYAHAFQLLLYVRRTDLDDENEAHWWQWVRDPAQADGLVAEIIRYTQDGVVNAGQIRNRFEEVRIGLLSLVDRRSRFVGMLVGAAPLMGLLGTVLGMLRTFFGISTSAGARDRRRDRRRHLRSARDDADRSHHLAAGALHGDADPPSQACDGGEARPPREPHPQPAATGVVDGPSKHPQ